MKGRQRGRKTIRLTITGQRDKNRQDQSQRNDQRDKSTFRHLVPPWSWTQPSDRLERAGAVLWDGPIAFNRSIAHWLNVARGCVGFSLDQTGILEYH